MTTKGAQLNTVPEVDDIAAWLMTEGLPTIRANAWALFLQGLSWRWIRPVVQITINSQQAHPKPVLEEAARASTSRAFVAAANRHLQKQEAPLDVAISQT